MSAKRKLEFVSLPPKIDHEKRPDVPANQKISALEYNTIGQNFENFNKEITYLSEKTEYQTTVMEKISELEEWHRHDDLKIKFEYEGNTHDGYPIGHATYALGVNKDDEYAEFNFIMSGKDWSGSTAGQAEEKTLFAIAIVGKETNSYWTNFPDGNNILFHDNRIHIKLIDGVIHIYIYDPITFWWDNRFSTYAIEMKNVRSKKTKDIMNNGSTFSTVVKKLYDSSSKEKRDEIAKKFQTLKDNYQNNKDTPLRFSKDDFVFSFTWESNKGKFAMYFKYQGKQIHVTTNHWLTDFPSFESMINTMEQDISTGIYNNTFTNQNYIKPLILLETFNLNDYTIEIV